jgi:hypothetical protein
MARDKGNAKRVADNREFALELLADVLDAAGSSTKPEDSIADKIERGMFEVLAREPELVRAFQRAAVRTGATFEEAVGETTDYFRRLCNCPPKARPH